MIGGLVSADFGRGRTAAKRRPGKACISEKFETGWHGISLVANREPYGAKCLIFVGMPQRNRSRSDPRVANYAMDKAVTSTFQKESRIVHRNDPFGPEKTANLFVFRKLWRGLNINLK